MLKTAETAARHPAANNRILSPLGRRRVNTQAIAPRLETLAGKTIGLLDNTKHNADILLAETAAILKRDHGVRTIVSRRKPGSSPGAGPLIPELAGLCDAVINAYGDCGSCTSWCIHDSVELEKRGVPTATVNSDEFAVLGQQEAVALGLPGLPIVTVPHPMGDVVEKIVRERASVMVAQVLKVLTTDAKSLEAEYTDKFLENSEKLRTGGLTCPL